MNLLMANITDLFHDFPSEWASYVDHDTIAKVGTSLVGHLEREQSRILPDRANWFRSLQLVSPGNCKVVIIGQDPYINIENGIVQAMGLSFSVPNGLRTPPSLRNIFKEMISDIGSCPMGTDLTPWASQGVLLLNAVLTVRAGESDSHKEFGWMDITRTLVNKLSARNEKIAFVLWGNKAKKLESAIEPARGHFVIKTPHPMPLSAYKGFFGSRPFSRINAFLRDNQRTEIDWSGQG